MSATQAHLQEVGQPVFIRLAAAVERQVTLSEDGSTVVKRATPALSIQLGRERVRIKSAEDARTFANAILEAATILAEEQAAAREALRG